MSIEIKTGPLTNQTFRCNISAPKRLPFSDIVKRDVIVYWPDDDAVVPIDRFEVFGQYGKVGTAWTGDTLAPKLQARRRAIAGKITI